MRIVIGYVHTPEGEAPLDQAIEEARLHEAHLTVVHSTLRAVPPAPTDGDFYEQELGWIDEMLTGEGIPHKMLEVLGETSAAENILPVGTR